MSAKMSEALNSGGGISVKSIILSRAGLEFDDRERASYSRGQTDRRQTRKNSIYYDISGKRGRGRQGGHSGLAFWYRLLLPAA